MSGSSRLDVVGTLEDVLSEPRFAAPAESWWDRLVQRVLAEAARLLAAVIEAVGGPVVAAFIAVGIVGAFALFVGFRLAGRRASVLQERMVLERLLEIGADPDSFLRDAEAASLAGEHARAIRLRFIGGVLDLGRTGRLRYEPGLTTGGMVEQIDDPAFGELADQFDRVVYGSAGAGADDDERSRNGWDRMRQST
ncbi:MAG TPA: hypothetical protein VLB67_13590 [Acidimicrobiia bacterium]|nr:hypothetical protein [Acidimicrobiia bacterium]